MRKNIVESDFYYKGYEIICTFTGLGHRCGYVVIPKGHRLYGMDISKVNELIQGYCGITWADYGRPCHKNDEWVIGFDCGHICDAPDEEAFWKYYPDAEPDSLPDYRFEYATVKSQVFVESECRSIVNQIIELDKNEN